MKEKVKVQELNPGEPHKRPNYMKRYGHRDPDALLFVRQIASQPG